MEHGHAPDMDLDMVGILLALFMVDVALEIDDDGEAELLPQDAA